MDKATVGNRFRGVSCERAIQTSNILHRGGLRDAAVRALSGHSCVVGRIG